MTVYSNTGCSLTLCIEKHSSSEQHGPWLDCEDAQADLGFANETGDNLNALRKHAYSNILKISPSKNEKFQIKNSDIFLISAQNVDCGTR